MNPRGPRVVLLLAVLLPLGCTSPDHSPLVGVPDSVYIQRGQYITATTFDTLRSSLLAAVSREGLAGAIAFCQAEALPITGMYAGDSIHIRRTARRYRNPHNRPDSLEMTLFASFDSAAFEARLIRTPEAVHYIKPIRLLAMCRSCHGTPGVHIEPATLAAIQKHYPDDRAIRFEEGDLRGFWHVTFYLKSQPQ